MRVIDADAVIDSVEADIAKFKTVIDEKAPYYVAAQMMYIAREVKESIKGYLAKAPTLDYAPKKQWISVKDRLPDTQHIMLVCTKNRNCVPKMAMAYYHDGFGWCGSGGRWGNVTHWMPLPEPPKEEE